jgi:outer membrane biosynthesis protein TonB
MPKNEDGEFEIVLGNKLILSVFFLVIILLSVFFVMGYILGQNSGKPEIAKHVDGGAPSASTQSPMPGAKSPTPTVVDSVTKPDEPPARSTPAPMAKTVEIPERPKPKETPKPIEVQAVSQQSVIQPVAGEFYVQVLALAKPEAEVLAEVLAKKGFKAFVSPGPNDRIFRVLVGPQKDAADSARVRGDVVQAGFSQAFVKKW